MTLLVTGSNGFLGAILVDRLLSASSIDAPIRCLVRSGSNRSRLERVIAQHPGKSVEIVTGSLATIDAADALLDDVTQVYHLAAALSGTAADMFLNTVVTTKNLMEAMGRRTSKADLIHISSFGVYGVADLPRGHVVTEETPLETNPAKRDLYSQAKLRQEQLVWDYSDRFGIPVVSLRPGVIYGPGGSALSTRVGLRLPGIYLHLGGRNLLPLSYVDNCADAIVAAGTAPNRHGQVYNVHDDDLVTAAAYLREYRREVEPLRAFSLPYPVTMLMSAAVERYHAYSKGQLPAILTPYKAAVAWKGNRFDNAKLHSIGWRPAVSTPEGMKRTFAALREKLAAA